MCFFLFAMDDESYLVFVYGTLKRNEPNSHFMTTSTFVAEATTVEKFPLIITTKYNIPFLIYKPGIGNNIKGEIYKVNTSTLAALDELENHPTLYVREMHSLVTKDGRSLTAWIYMLKTYKPELLELEFYDCYLSQGDHGKRYHSSEADDPENQEEILAWLKKKVM